MDMDISHLIKVRTLLKDIEGGLQLVEIGLKQSLGNPDLYHKIIQSFRERAREVPLNISSASLDASLKEKVGEFKSKSDIQLEINNLRKHLDQIKKNCRRESKKLSFGDYWRYLNPEKPLSVLVFILFLGGYLIASIPEVKPPADEWRYTFQNPKSNWNQEAYDDSNWLIGKAPFGNRSTETGAPTTNWSTPAIWLRRTFTLNDLPKNRIYLTLFHDDDVEVFLNGTEIFRKAGFSSGYSRIKLDNSVRNLLKVGKNTLAAHCVNLSGVQIINLSIGE